MALDMAFAGGGIGPGLTALLPPGVSVALADPAAPPEGLFAAEAAAMARAVPVRRAEFAAGRRAARDAMAALGLSPMPVAMGPDRAPVWPRGVVGSISHCPGAALAIAAKEVNFQALGVDIEPDEGLPDEVVDLVCSPQELDRLAGWPGLSRGRAARLVFSAKECAFKLQYRISHKMLDFSDLKVDFQPDQARFSARFAAPVAPFSAETVLQGRFGRQDGFMFCASFIQ